MHGICGLCHKSKNLKDSHFMPKSIYRSISKGFPEIGDNIVLISGHEKTAAYNSKQAKKHLLCEECENKFSRNGENIVIPLMAKPNGFKLARAIKKFKLLSCANNEIWYFPPNDDLAKAFMYFAISIAWRLSSADWGNFGIPETKGIIRGEYIKIFSDFLMGKTDTPNDTYLAVYVHNRNVDLPFMCFPTVKNHEGYQHIIFYIPGIRFSLLVGEKPGKGILETFSINKTKVYFVSRNLKSHPEHKFIVNFAKHEAKAKGNLAKELSAKNV
jgi:hypothetical protein